jgi:hypothetical protein
MSNNLDTNNNLSDIATGFQNDWPLSNSDVKLTKKQQDNVKALKNFFTKMDEDVGERNQFLNRVWSNKAKMPSLYPEKSVTWEAQIYNAFDEAGIDIRTWFVDMANDRKAVYGTSAGGWFRNEGEKKDLPHVHNFESVPILEKEREYKYFKVNAVDMPKEPDEDASSIITQIQLYHYAIGVSEETLCQSSYTLRKALFAFRLGPLAYNLFHLLYSILSNAENEKENFWVKLNKETLTYFWKEFENDGKHKLQCIGELAILFVCIFGRMLLTVRLENTKKMFKLLGTPYDVEARKVSILSSIVDQSHSII